MKIHSNAMGLFAWRNLEKHNNNISKALGRLSSGCRINSAADDPAGLAVSEKLKMQLTLIKTDRNNAMDAQSALNVADGTLGEIQSMLNRMTELANQAASGTYTDDERKLLDQEYQQLLKEINRQGQSSSFNGRHLFGDKGEAGSTGTGVPGGLNGGIVIEGGNLEAYLDGLDNFLLDISEAAKKGDNEALLSLGIDRSNGKTDGENLKSAVLDFTKGKGQLLLNTPRGDGKENGMSYTLVLSDGDISVNLPTVDDKNLGLEGSNLLTKEDALKAVKDLKGSINTVSSWRGNIGAMYNRLDHTINNLSNMEMNLTDALSRILDADMAKEMMNLVKEQVLAQASMFALAQVNQQPEQVLTLLKSI